MKVLKFKRHIEIDKTIGNIRIETFHFGEFDKNGKRKYWTELRCWYECDCEHCPLSWEERGLEDCDCGCYMAEYSNDYPKSMLICMLPYWVKRLIKKIKGW